MKKVELLAPAGSFESFLGAIHAGADAVYIGGKQYGARAYAENFTEEEVCLAIRYAHLFGRKLYLTLNTLVKEREMAGLPAYVRPFYEEGLDGVIVQDLGVFSLLREYFPQLKLHGSTQMTVTGARGAKFLLEQGACRVVPARELSLEEIRRVKETGIEVEVFVHGAMCYAYSGQCLFSSMLGGRSGNRGRCAQPCRLPYGITAADDTSQNRGQGGRQPDEAGQAVYAYPMSLKDLCALTLVPELIEAGVDSFKIEGRMKKPEYAAGVTAVYRKYIDAYLAAPEREFAVSKEDAGKLRGLYIRSGLQEGYYHRHNGREMVTPDRPGYAGLDEAYLRQIREAFLERTPGIPICGEIAVHGGRPVRLTVWTKGRADDGRGARTYRIDREGQTPQAAQRQPLTEEAVKKHICKTGNTPFFFESLTVDAEPDLFLPVKALNDLRRDALSKLERAVLEPYRRRVGAPEAVETAEDMVCAKDLEENGLKRRPPYLAVQIQRADQLAPLSGVRSVDRIYVDGDCVVGQNRPGVTEGAKSGKQDKERMFDALRAWKESREGRSLFFAMPYIIRLRDEDYLKEVRSELLSGETIWDGVLIRNLESLYWLGEIDYRGEMTGDANLYIWNRRAKSFLSGMGIAGSVPLECSKEALKELDIRGMEMIVYGRAVLMVSANCVRKTGMRCAAERVRQGQSGPETRLPAGDTLVLRDRYDTDFPVRTVCGHCYNEIYNSVPMSLHEYGRSIVGQRPAGVRLCFTTERAEEIARVLTCYEDFATEPGRSRQAAFSYTKGHYKRGAE